MGEVIELRSRIPHARAAATARHPALRWVAGEMWWLSHRVDLDTDRPVCGADGPLILAPPAVPLCRVCFYTAAR